MKIISWYAHKEKDNKSEEKVKLEKFPSKSLFKIIKSKKQDEKE